MSYRLKLTKLAKATSGSGSKLNSFKMGYILTTLVLASCAWLGDATTPSVELPQKFSSATDKYQNIESLPYLAWWQQFNDSQLTHLLESGLVNNLDVKIAISNLEMAEGQLKQVQLSWIPFVNIYAGYTSNPALGNAGTLYGIWPQYTINIFKLYKQQQQAKYNVAASQAMVDGIRLTLIGQITASYFTLISQQEQLRLLNALDQDMQELISLTRKELKIGLRDSIDITQLLSDEKLIKAQISLIQQNLILSQNSLRYLLNQNPGTIKSTNNFDKLDFSKFKPGNLPATVLQNRPDLIIAENMVKASHEGVGVAYGNLFPAIQLDSFAGAGSLNGTVANPNQFMSMNDAYLNWGINPSTFGQIEAQKGAYQANVYRYIQTVRKILKEVDDSYAANKNTGENFLNTQASWQDLNKKYQLQQGLYKTGIISYPQLLENRLNVDKLALIVNQSKLQQALTLVNLYQNLAGGYKYAPDKNETQDTK